MYKKIAIIGVGLIGGSIGLVLTNKRLAEKIVGVDLNEQNLNLAIELGAIDEATSSLSEGVYGADLVILAAPVRQTILILEAILPYLASGTLITDVGSTKTEIIYRAEKLLPSHIYFVGGHPMAGSEMSGVQGADRHLFENAYYLITPTEKTNPDALNRVKEMVGLLGARVVELKPEEHDQAVAVISHLPHLVASALVNTVANFSRWENILPLAAGGFRDTTRIALGSPVMWRDIFLSNKEKILQILDEFKKQLGEFTEAINQTDGEMIMELLKSANRVRSVVPSKSKGYLPALFEIVVTIPDQPGMLAEITGLLGKNGINIMDIEILRVREGKGGTLRLGFADEEAQKKAIQVLRERHFVARTY
ncbi:prephenate dehydrogenase [Desulfolucanica intricata]|uniref:prephenate dehydrogenase n=1 Tax=Desulfolucanica intricata TaxID=1285191 RepID=UPI0008370F15|nr:prephenate dehydrogenase [Desulfolucanica intricata]